MKFQLPSGLNQGISFIIPADWTAEQALAVFELLDDLRQQICVHYGVQLHEILREQRGPANTSDDSNSEIDDDSF